MARRQIPKLGPMMKFRIVCLAVCFFALKLLAQQSPAAKPTTDAISTPIFKARSQLVLVPVIVNDKTGKHVQGLTKDKFRLEEEGKSRDFSLFEEVLPQPDRTPVPLPKRAPDVATNFAGDVSRPSPFTIIVLDMVNTPFLKQADGRRQLIEFLSKGLTADEPVTLLGLSDHGIVQLHSSTTETRVLIAALEKLRGSTSSNEIATAEAQRQTDLNADLMESADETAQQISQFMQDAIDMMAMLQQQDSIRRTLDGLDQIAAAYSGNRSRKTLIWASGGFPFLLNDPHAFTHLGTDMVEKYQETWRALTSANIAVYPVELTGLDSRVVDASRSRASYQSGRSRHGNPMGTSGALPYNSDDQRQDTLRAFADATGGRVCLNTNDFKKCFADSVSDSESYYLLGYYLPNDDDKPGWRSLKVHVSSPDTHVRARQGFYVAPPPQDTPSTRRQELVTALSSPFEYTGIVMDVRSASFRPIVEKQISASMEKKIMQDFMVHIPPSSLMIDSGRNNRVDLEIAAVAVDGTGKDVSRFSQGVQVSFNPDMLARVLKTGVALKESMELVPGKYDCRFVVRDNQSGQIGTVHMPFEVK